MWLLGAAWARSAMVVITVTACAAGGLAASGCSCDSEGGAGDAGVGPDGSLVGDASPRVDAAELLIWLDFSVTGCDSPATGAVPHAGPAVDAGPIDAGSDPVDGGFGPIDEVCDGVAPLRLSFVPVAPAAVDLYEWSFGDGSEPDRRPSPEHVFDEPGTYDVSLFGQGPGGTAAVTKPALVRVRPGALGNACSADSQCASGACVCGAEPCAGLASGFCSSDCSATGCEEGVCADLAPVPPAEPAAWRGRLCLPDCSDGASCPAGTICRSLRRGDGDGWVAACFAPGLLGDVGDPCSNGEGALDDSLCASGECLALGLRGVCSAGCSDVACPLGAACATFNGGEPGPSCLARCGDAACDADPWLACQAPGGSGAAGFTVDEEPVESGYCAPAPCDGPDDCPQGQCAGGFCSP